MELSIACDKRHASSCWSTPTKTHCAQLYTALLCQLNSQQDSQPSRRKPSPGDRRPRCKASCQKEAANRETRTAKTTALLPEEPVAQTHQNAGPETSLLLCFLTTFQCKNTTRKDHVFTTRTHRLLQHSVLQAEQASSAAGRLRNAGRPQKNAQPHTHPFPHI